VTDEWNVSLAISSEEVIDGEKVRFVLDAEEDAIQTYHELIDAAEAADDPVTEDLAVMILEEVHRTEFRGFEKEYQND